MTGAELLGAELSWASGGLLFILLAIVVWVIRAILTDMLVTRKRLEEQREDTKAWRISAETQQAVNAELNAAVQEILPLARATHHAMTSIQSLAKLGRAPEEESP